MEPAGAGGITTGLFVLHSVQGLPLIERPIGLNSSEQEVKAPSAVPCAGISVPFCVGILIPAKTEMRNKVLV
jgi:hypothetical protein